jgi:CheY-like chemotaxis protein
VKPATGPEVRGRILVVDDEPLVARAVRRLLAGHEIVVASDGQEALEICARETFDVVLCDVMMPGLSGVEVYRRLSAADPAWTDRFVFVTGGAFAQGVAEALDATGIDRVSKPIDAARLRQVVAGRIRAH